MCTEIEWIGSLSTYNYRADSLTKNKFSARNANITSLDDLEFDYKPSKKYPQGKAKIRVLLDEVTYRRYLASFDLGQDKDERRYSKGEIKKIFKTFS